MLIPLIVLYICDVAHGSDGLFKPFYNIDNARNHFEDFIIKYNKSYANEEEKEKRLKIFKEKLQEINELNWGNDHAVFEINTFSDLTKEEFFNKFTGLKQKSFRRSGSNCLTFTDKDVKTKTAPIKFFDWRDYDVVTRNKNQRDCGSCWAVSTTGMIEGQLAMRHKILVPLSVQQLLDCVDQSGCTGGDPREAISKLIEQGGQMLEADYPYEIKKRNCRFDKNKVVVNVTECHEFALKDEKTLKQLLYTRGPLVVALNIETLSVYKGGIIKYSKCNDKRKPNHAVLLVGYGQEFGTGYWILKNSYQDEWGENGYFRLEYGKNTCGLMTSSIFTAVIDYALGLQQKIRFEIEQAAKHFEKFIRDFEKQYPSAETKAERFEIFKRKLVELNRLNDEHPDIVYGQHSTNIINAKVCITMFADLTNEEFQRSFISYKSVSRSGSRCEVYNDNAFPFNPYQPKSFSWAQQLVVSQARRQQGCGSCWAFASTGAVESQFAIKHRRPISLSVQQLVDCVPYTSCSTGGRADLAFSTLIDRGGQMLEKDYMYQAMNLYDKFECRYDWRKVAVRIKSCSIYELETEHALREVLMLKGPLVVAIDGKTIKSFGDLKDGILSMCSEERNHAVLLVGYSIEGGIPYWILKNSWGDDWGVNGYFRLRMGLPCKVLHDVTGVEIE